MFEIFEDAYEDAEEGTATTASNLASSDYWDGVPVVRMEGDSDEDVIDLLSALYRRSFFRMYGTTPVTTIASLLRMSSKYDFVDLRNETIRSLQRVLPDRLGDYRRRRNFKDHLPFNDVDYYTFLAIASKYDARILLPTLYYLCAIGPKRTRAKHAHHISAQDRNILQAGHAKMMKAIEKFTTPPEGFGDPKACARVQLQIVTWCLLHFGILLLLPFHRRAQDATGQRR